MSAPLKLWNSLEIAKLVIGVLTPLSLAAFGWFISRSLKRFELLQWSNQKLIEKRLILYDSIAPLLNKLLCFYTWVGYWKDVSPQDVIKAKRELDQSMNVYRHLFDDDLYNTYQSFIHLLFEPFTGRGHDAKIRSVIQGADGDRKAHRTYEWDPVWETKFSAPDNVAAKAEVGAAYYQVMKALRRSLGVLK